METKMVKRVIAGFTLVITLFLTSISYSWEYYELSIMWSSIGWFLLGLMARDLK